MAYPNITAGNIMDTAAVLNNDPAKTRYTYAKQIPFLNVALRCLQRQYELNEIPVTATLSAIIPCTSATVAIGFTTTPPINLPNDLVEPKLLWERARGIDPFIPMTKLNFLPQQLSGVLTNDYIYYVWQSQQIQLLPTNQNNDIKIDYTKFLFIDIVSDTDVISVINAQGYLEFKTGALIASLLAENPTRAGELEAEAANALDEALGISTKGRQAIATRHRPFRAGYKRAQNY